MSAQEMQLIKHKTCQTLHSNYGDDIIGNENVLTLKGM